MKGISTLIKLGKRRVDELRRQMALLENQKAQLQQKAQQLSDELATELVLAGQQAEMARFFGDFAKRIQARQEKIAAEIAALEKRMSEQAARISDAFTELKRYEIAKDRLREREREAQNRRDTALMDDIAQQQFERKKR